MIEPYLRQSALDHLGLAGRATTVPSDAGVTLAERVLPVAVTLRGNAGDPAFAEAVRGALGVAPPTAPNTVAAGDGLALLWLGPDEWLAVQHNAAPGAETALAEKLRGALAGLHGSVVEVGESLCCIAVAGPRARDLVAKGCPLDLHPRGFGGANQNGGGHCAQSHLAKAGITLHQVDDTPAFDLYVRRSFADYLWRWLEDAAREYGLAVVRP
jgi:sarcosine oxidase subunit gamma